jgi:hypothetical protein
MLRFKSQPSPKWQTRPTSLRLPTRSLYGLDSTVEWNRPSSSDQTRPCLELADLLCGAPPEVEIYYLRLGEHQVQSRKAISRSQSLYKYSVSSVMQAKSPRKKVVIPDLKAAASLEKILDMSSHGLTMILRTRRALGPNPSRKQSWG